MFQNTIYSSIYRLISNQLKNSRFTMTSSALIADEKSQNQPIIVENDDQRTELIARICAKSEEVRALKAEKAASELVCTYLGYSIPFYTVDSCTNFMFEIKKAVDELVALKLLTGEEVFKKHNIKTAKVIILTVITVGYSTWSNVVHMYIQGHSGLWSETDGRAWKGLFNRFFDIGVYNWCFKVYSIFWVKIKEYWFFGEIHPKNCKLTAGAIYHHRMLQTPRCRNDRYAGVWTTSI